MFFDQRNYLEKVMNKRRFALLFIVGIIFTSCTACINSTISQTNTIQETSAKAAATITENLYNPPHKDFRIVVISDLNSQYGSTEYDAEVDQAISLIPQWQPNLVLCSGDMIAGQKRTLTQSQIEAMWKAFDSHITTPLRQNHVPFGFTIGNHDGSGAIVNGESVFENERELAKAYWNDIQPSLSLNLVDKANFPFYYSFKEHDIFFLVWDASTDHISSDQLAWVTKTLASKAAQQAKMRIVIGHLPLYAIATAKNKPGEYLAEAEKLRSLLEQNQVHTYISGHHHAYYPGKKGQLELLHVGALGQGARQLIGSDLPPRKTITVVDIEIATGKTFYTTYDMRTLETIEIKELPPSITGNNGTIIRRDLIDLLQK
jgi:Icc-related predicted phosphoesterase